MQPKQALSHIVNGESDYAEALAIFADDSRATAMTTAAARLADDMAEAFGDSKLGAAAGDPAGAIVHIAKDDGAKAQRIRMLASFGAMARELRRLQDSEAEIKRQRNALQVEASALESTVTQHAATMADLRDRLANYRTAAARFTFGDIRHGSAHHRALFRAYEADAMAESAEERGEK